MTQIDIRIQNLGMSGMPWAKHGSFECPFDAAKFLVEWWNSLSCPTGWELEIDGREYNTVPPREEAEAHICYCYSVHQAFYQED